MVAGADEDMPTVSWWGRMSRWRQTSVAEARASERRLLSEFKCDVVPTDITFGPGATDYLHTLVGGSESAPPLVVMPGYGAAAGFYFRNLNELSRHFRLYCVDWLGTGLSGRPHWAAENTDQAEAFFIDSLAEWRNKVGLGKFVLVGHSLGGYLATQYALKHPDHIHSLILVGPAGVPRRPENWEKEVTSSGGMFRKMVLNLLRHLWNRGTTPGDVLRALGPLGPALVDGYVSGRFSRPGSLTEQEAGVFKSYFYHVSALPGSGEYALPHLLAPGAWAHKPIGENLVQLKVPVTFIYGESDWMSPKSAVAACKEALEQRAPLSPVDLQVLMVPDSGHFVFLEQPVLFHEQFYKAVAPVLRLLRRTSKGSTPDLTLSEPVAADHNVINLTVSATSA